jgi:hypothetical protein
MKSPYSFRLLVAVAALSIPTVAFAHPVQQERSHTPTVHDRTPQPHNRTISVHQSR